MMEKNTMGVQITASETWLRRIIALTTLFILLLSGCRSSVNQDKVASDKRQLMINDSPYIIKGICYHPVPKGSDKRDFNTLTQDLELMTEAGINTIRVYEPIVERSVLDEIDRAGMKVIIGFGYDQKGAYDLRSGTFIDYVKIFKDHAAILMWELGNEYNYHPEWFENDLCNWYRLVNDGAAQIQAVDKNRPVTTAHGELPDTLALNSCPNIDVWGMNVYRWDNPEELFEEWKTLSTKPMYLSEAGSDSYMTMAKSGYESGVNEKAQAEANRTILKTVFNTQGLCSGVTLFSFTDGWWKAGDSDEQNPGGWAPNSTGVPYDGTPNEEYWGIVTIDRRKKEAFDVVKEAYRKTNEK